MDLRRRVLAAIAEGVSGRSAGRRFGVSAPSVSRWRALERALGDATPKPIGGDHRSHRTEAHAAAIFSALEAAPDLTLEELREKLAQQRVFVSHGALWGFSIATRSRAKKDRARQRAGPTGHREAARGLVRGTTRPRPATPCLYRRDLGLHQHGAPVRVGRRAANGCV